MEEQNESHVKVDDEAGHRHRPSILGEVAVHSIRKVGIGARNTQYEIVCCEGEHARKCS